VRNLLSIVLASGCVFVPMNALRSGGQTTDSSGKSLSTRETVPFTPGEALTYVVQYGPFRGFAAMTVRGIDTLRGREVWHTELRIEGSALTYRIHDRLESWFDTETLFSLRHIQEDLSRDRVRTFEIFPESAQYQENAGPLRPSVSDPLDDGAFLYWVRTVPLEVGASYSWDRYFRPERNPVRLIVLGRERIRVPAGEFETIVVQPIIKSKGIFSEGGEAILWLSADEKRWVIQMRAKIPKIRVGAITLKLKEARPRT
jgi:hypothetical protein